MTSGSVQTRSLPRPFLQYSKVFSMMSKSSDIPVYFPMPVPDDFEKTLETARMQYFPYPLEAGLLGGGLTRWRVGAEDAKGRQQSILCFLCIHRNA